MKFWTNCLLLFARWRLIALTDSFLKQDRITVLTEKCGSRTQKGRKGNSHAGIIYKLSAGVRLCTRVVRGRVYCNFCCL